MGEPRSPESTAELLASVRRGDRGAMERLVARYLPILTNYAHGRLPHSARSLIDTNDIVLITLQRALAHVATFEPRHEGAFLAYLRKVVLNRIRDEARRVARRPEEVELDENHEALVPSPLEDVIGAEALERYEAALRILPEARQKEVVLRLEMGLSYAEIAKAVGSSSPNAVRMSIARALTVLARAMGPRGDRHG